MNHHRHLDSLLEEPKSYLSETTNKEDVVAELGWWVALIPSIAI